MSYINWVKKDDGSYVAHPNEWVELTVYPVDGGFGWTSVRETTCPLGGAGPYPLKQAMLMATSYDGSCKH